MLECTCMRTTVEIRDDQRLALVALASKKGIRGFSVLVQDAIDLYLAEQRPEAIRDALALRGTLTDQEAEEMRRRIDQAWAGWRTAS